MNFTFGLEHEVAFLRADSSFADFSNTAFTEFDQIIRELPIFDSDYPQLRVGDAGIKVKRWYIEGYERFGDSEKVIGCLPKGIEIRTTLHDSIKGVIAELCENYALLRQVAVAHGFSPVCISFNPYLTIFTPDPPLNAYEHRRRMTSPEMQTAEIVMLTYGPDLSFSIAGLSTEKIIDIGRKLTFYSPYILPFSFSSPFYGGEVWDGLSVRTFHRTGPRPACMVFIDEPDKMIDSAPSLTQHARVPAETGRIEFKAFDSCCDFSLYAALLALLKGLGLDDSLPDRATTPDAARHQHVARVGFSDDAICQEAGRVLAAAREALGDDPDADLLVPLEQMLVTRETQAGHMIRAYREQGSISAAFGDEALSILVPEAGFGA
ncbi:MAG TPA: glutamate--cysteine ligase [Caldilineae bacterium]|nr:glutamate--cysteine ligase [Caldilineae bacterium]